MQTTEAAEPNVARKNDAGLGLSAVGASSSVMRELLTDARRAARAPSTVLITGESGSGKECLARFIHRESRRASAPFVTIKCAAIAENLLENRPTLFSRGG
jgi:transcriptional regulator with PAS, ATPase and Fis domain